jgi:putative chitobiose transport system substrate-binding protein
MSRRTALGVLSAGAMSLAALSLPGCAGGRGDRPLSVWTLALSPFFDDYIKGLLDSFSKANGNIPIEWVDVPYEAIDRKLMAAAAAGRAPDVINLADRTFARFIGMGALADLNPLLPASIRDGYLKGASRIGAISGRQLALPWYLTTQSVLANTRLLAKGGIEADALPDRWAPMLAMAGDFKRKTGKPITTLPLGFESDIPMMLLSDGISPLIPGPDGNLVSALTDPRILAAIEPWVGAFRQGWLPREAATGGSSHLNKLFVEGDVATINSGPNFLKRIAADAPDIFRTTTVRPAVTGTLGRAHIAVMTLGVTTQSTKPELAARLAAHLTSSEAQLDLCRRAVVLPSTSASLADPLFSAPPPMAATVTTEAGTPPSKEEIDAQVGIARAACAAQLPDAVAFTPAMACWPDLRRTFEDAFKRVLLDGADLRRTLAEVDTSWNGILADRPADISALPLVGPVGGSPRAATTTPAGAAP